ncbi:hypothetical protein [Kitasatospora aureofaciens]|uniref:hypothetical protein n=1 Tax=Kitasatospora aureofaciens TaxID=1894 RepID=UPI001D3B2A56|nr:hypothetical protein [Kitasatospora aureofaciens]HJD84158.1 hypothetical protein [Kitasatospora aureofaciens]
MAHIPTTKLQISAQRGRRGAPTAHVVNLGRGTAPVVLVVPQQPSFAGRLALATGRALWRRRVAWAPTWFGIGVFGTAGVLSVAEAPIALVFAVPAVLLPGGWALIAHRHPRSAVRRKARARTRAVAAWSAGLSWSALAVWFGPTNGLLAAAWLAGTAAAQTLWWQCRRKLATTPLDAPQS